MIDTGANQKSIQPVHVKNRNEVLAGQKFEKAHQKSTKSKKEKGNDDPEKQKKKAMQAKVKEFYASKGVSPVFHKVNGKKIELEYDAEYGLQNALHLIMRHPNQTVYNYLMSQDIPIDAKDFKSRNAFSVGIDKYML